MGAVLEGAGASDLKGGVDMKSITPTVHVLALAALCMLGCSESTSASGNGDWVSCTRDDDCARHPDAVRCEDAGYCVDVAGARIDRAGLTDNSAAGDGNGDGDGDGDTSPCVPQPVGCNAVDDDCDGDSDEQSAADAFCETEVINAVTFCDGAHSVCVPVKCLAGFAQCDGDPTNGCEDDCFEDPSGSGSDAGQ